MSHESELIDKRAAAFLVRSQNETEAQRIEREAWLATDPRHLHAYRTLQKLDERATSVLDDPVLREASRRDLEALEHSRRQRRRWLWLAIALGLVVVGYALKQVAVD